MRLEIIVISVLRRSETMPKCFYCGDEVKRRIQAVKGELGCKRCYEMIYMEVIKND